MGKVTKFNSEAYAILEATPTQSRLIIYFEELELIFCTFVQPNKTRFWKARFNGGLQGLLRPRNPRNSQHLLPHLLSLLEVLRTDLLLDQYYRRRWGPLQATDLKYSYASTRRMLFISPQLYQCMHCFLFFPLLRSIQVFTYVLFSSAGMYMQEALELVCRKRKLQNPNDYALLLADKSILIPLDRTVASLQGKRELLLVKKSMLPQMDAVILKGIGKTTDPNGMYLFFWLCSDLVTNQYLP